MSCLRVTCLLHRKSSLFIGTSAGVVLQLPLPTIAADTTTVSGSLAPIAVTEGHAGPVNFIASMVVDNLQEERIEGGNTLASIPESPPPSGPSSTLVFTGGEGFEDFVSSMPCDDISDNTSCVNIWKC